MPTKKAIIIARTIPVVVAAAGLIAILLWIRTQASFDLHKRVPQADQTIQQVSGEESAGSKILQGSLEKFTDVAASDLPGAWPRFRGANFDNIARTNGQKEFTPARQWPADGPKAIWSVEMGEGYAGAAIASGRVYVLDYDRNQQADVLRCLSLADGRDIWRYSYPVKVKRNHGMSRTVPAISDKYVVSLGPKCHVTCLDSTTGKLYWMIDLVKEYGSKVPPWYAGQCPLLDGERVILAPAGKQALLIAVHADTGKVIWQSENPHNWSMTHSSIIPMEWAGKKMYLYCAGGGVVGVSADDGKILWETDEWKISIANIPSPVILEDGRIFLSGGYNAGSMMLQLSDGPDISARILYRLPPEVFGCPQQSPIYYEGYLYGVRPDEELVCLDPAGNVVWTSTSAYHFGLGSYMIVDGIIYVLNDTGLLTMALASPAGFHLLGQAKVLSGTDSWGPMAFAGGRLILRDLTSMVCLDVTGAGSN